MKIVRLGPCAAGVFLVVLWFVVGSTGPACAAAPKADKADKAAKTAKADRWEKEIQAFEAADRKCPPPQGANLIIGSSGVKLWKTLAADFPKHKMINRGFGGSQIADAVRYAERIVTACKPRLVVLRAGSNDLHAGKSPETVFADYKAFVAKIHAVLPETEIIFMSINPSPARWEAREREKETNRLIREYAAGHKLLGYIDAYTPMLGPDGLPKAELYAKDRLHNSPEGYRLWVKLLEPHLK